MTLRYLFIGLLLLPTLGFGQNKPSLPIQFKDITMPNGVIFEGGTITAYDLDVITIMTPDGISRYKWSDAPKELQKLIGEDIDKERQTRNEKRQEEIDAAKQIKEDRLQGFLNNPPQPETNGTYKFVTDYLKSILLSPESLSIYAVSKPYYVQGDPSDKNRPPGWCVKCDWGAQIKSGGRDRHTDEFILPVSGETYSYTLQWREATQ